MLRPVARSLPLRAVRRATLAAIAAGALTLLVANIALGNLLVIVSSESTAFAEHRS